MILHWAGGETRETMRRCVKTLGCNSRPQTSLLSWGLTTVCSLWWDNIFHEHYLQWVWVWASGFQFPCLILIRTIFHESENSNYIPTRALSPETCRPPRLSPLWSWWPCLRRVRMWWGSQYTGNGDIRLISDTRSETFTIWWLVCFIVSNRG